MGQPSSHILAATASTKGDSHKAMEESLTNLWRAKRLGVHMFEHHKGLDFPSYSQSGLSALCGQSNHEALQQYEYGKTPLVSLSLIPPTDIRYVPFHFGRALENRLGYAIDLSQDIPNPALVVRAAPGDIGTEFDFYRKNLHIRPEMYWSDDRTLDQLYKGYTAHDFVRAVGQTGSTLSEDQLNALISDYERLGNDNAFDSYNEVVAAVSNDHIKAIVCHLSPKLSLKNAAYEKTICTMAVALSALDHIHHGIDVPAILYHLDAPRDQAMEYIGQGEAELRHVAKKAMVELYAYHSQELYTGLLGWHDIEVAASRILNIPVNTLDRQIQKAAKELPPIER